MSFFFPSLTTTTPRHAFPSDLSTGLPDTAVATVPPCAPPHPLWSHASEGRGVASDSPSDFPSSTRDSRLSCAVSIPEAYGVRVASVAGSGLYRYTVYRMTWKNTANIHDATPLCASPLRLRPLERRIVSLIRAYANEM